MFKTSIPPARKRVGATPFELKSLKAEIADSETGTIEGYASVFSVVDQSGDRVAPGAFAKTLAKRGAAGIRMLYQHLAAEPVGFWTFIKEDAYGLFVRGRLLTEVSRAREVMSLMRGRALDGLSIGFRTVQSERGPGQKIRTLTEIDLWEVSIVTFPMLDGARVTSVKARSNTIFKTLGNDKRKDAEIWATRANWK